MAAEDVEIIPIDRALSQEEALVYSHNRLDTLSKMNRTDRKTETAKMRHLLQLFANGENGVQQDIEEMIESKSYLANDELQYDLLRFGDLDDDKKQNVLMKIRKNLRINTNFQKPPPRAMGFHQQEYESPYPSRAEPIVSEQILEENFKKFKERTAWGNCITQKGMAKLMESSTTEFSPAMCMWLVTQRPSLVLQSKYWKAFIIKAMKAPLAYKGADPSWYSRTRIFDSFTLQQLDELPEEQKTEQWFIEIYIRKLVPIVSQSAENKPETNYAYCQLVYDWILANLCTETGQEKRGIFGMFSKKSASSSQSPWDWFRIQVWGRKLKFQFDIEKDMPYEEFMAYCGDRMYSTNVWDGRVQPNEHIENTYKAPSTSINTPVELGLNNFQDSHFIQQGMEFFVRKAVCNEMNIDIDQIKSLLVPNVFKEVYGRIRIEEGETDGAIFDEYKKNFGDISYMENKKQLRLDTSHEFNKEHFKMGDEVKLQLVVQNVPQISVKVFRINLRSYYEKHLAEIPTDLNLEGLTATIELTQDIDYRSKFHVVNVPLDFPELTDKLGVFFVDIFGAGLATRAVIKKGVINYILRTSSAGQVFTLIDEQCRVLKNGKMWMDNHEFTASESGEIYVPYSTSPQQQKVIFSAGEYPEFCCLGGFYHEGEKYEFDCGFHIDREQILNKKKASLVIRSSAKANGSPCSLEVVENVTVVINISDTSGVDTTKTFERITLSITEDTVLSFRIPVRCHKLNVHLTGRIKYVSRSDSGSYYNINKSQSFSYNDLLIGNAIEDAHLVPLEQGYAIAYLGRNGEGLPNVETAVQFVHDMCTDTISKQCKTDGNGYIYLPVLDGVTAIRAFQKEWRINRKQNSEAPNAFSVVANTRFNLGLQTPPGVTNPSDAVLLTDSASRENFTNLLSIENTNLVAPEGLPDGTYTLRYDYGQSNMTISAHEGVVYRNYVLGDNYVEMSNLYQLSIMGIEGNRQNGWKVEVSKRDARLHVVATHFQTLQTPKFDVEKPSGSAAIAKSSPQSFYTPQRTISEEQRYVLERAKAPRFMGNMLQKPSFLMKPWSNDSANSNERAARAGENIAHRLQSMAYAEASRSMRHKKMGYSNSHLFSGEQYVDFIDNTSTVLSNLHPVSEEDANGMTHYYVYVPADDIQADHRQLQFICVDATELALADVKITDEYLDDNQEDLGLEAPAFNYNDLRLMPGLDPEKHFTDQKSIVLLNDPSQEFEVEDYVGSQVESYDTLAQVFQLFKTLAGSCSRDLNDWEFLTEWGRLTEEKKMDKFDKYTCHELNFFLYNKDREFFDRVVLPFIGSKLNKDLIDNYFLQNYDALLPFTEMHLFSQLNTLEKILLADAFREHKPELLAATVNFFEKQKDAQKVDPERLDQLFKTALKGRALEEPRAVPQAAPAAAWSRENTSQQRKKHKSRMRSAGGGPRRSRGGAMLSQVRGGRSLKKKSAPVMSSNSFMANAAPPPPVPEMMMNHMEGFQMEEELAEDMMMRGELMEKQAVFFQGVEQTKIYQETYYYKIPRNKGVNNLIKMNSFWCDFAIYWLGDRSVPFLSEHLALPTNNLNEILFAVGAFGLDFDATGMNVQWSPNNVSVQITSSTPAVVFSKELKEKGTEESSISITTFYYDPNDLYSEVNGERTDKFVDVFHPGKIYGCRAVLANISSTQLVLELLQQIPSGAIPLQNKTNTETSYVTLGAYQTKMVEFLFYFPTVGTYRHFPVQVAKVSTGFVVGFGAAGELNVQIPESVREVNLESWSDVALNASHEVVLKYLEEHNIVELQQKNELNNCFWRLGDFEFYQPMVTLLRSQMMYQYETWCYAFRHAHDHFDEVKREIRDLVCMKHDKVLGGTKDFDSELCSFNSFTARSYTHLEFYPLVNARAHILGQKREIVNKKLHSQYENFLQLCLGRSTCVDDMCLQDKLGAVYYLLVQDRVQEALAVFRLIDENNAQAQCDFTFDYLQAYLDFYSDEQTKAKAVVNKWAPVTLPASKSKLISDIEAGLNELGNYVYEESENIDRGDRDRQMDAMASNEPSFEFKAYNREIELEYFNCDEITINYYKMDVELMFSVSPFSMSGDGGNFSFIEPNVSKKYPLDRNERVAVTKIAIPEDLHYCNVYIEILSGPVTKSTSYFDSNLIVQVKQKAGQLKVVGKSESGQYSAVPRAYVKVYAKTNNGNEFYKDGYTDIRGRFDYASISTDALKRTKEFSILVTTDDAGSVVTSTKPPKQ